MIRIAQDESRTEEPFVGRDEILRNVVVLIEQTEMVLRYLEMRRGFPWSDKCATVSSWGIGKLPDPSAFGVGDRLEIGRYI